MKIIAELQSKLDGVNAELLSEQKKVVVYRVHYIFFSLHITKIASEALTSLPSTRRLEILLQRTLNYNIESNILSAQLKKLIISWSKPSDWYLFLQRLLNPYKTLAPNQSVF